MFLRRKLTASTVLLGSLFFGILDVLAPLHLSHAGWAPSAIGAVWVVAAAIEGLGSPLVGRVSDRRGIRTPVLYGLAAGGVVSLALTLDLDPVLYDDEAGKRALQPRVVAAQLERVADVERRRFVQLGVALA